MPVIKWLYLVWMVRANFLFRAPCKIGFGGASHSSELPLEFSDIIGLDFSLS